MKLTVKSSSSPGSMVAGAPGPEIVKSADEPGAAVMFRMLRFCEPTLNSWMTPVLVPPTQLFPKARS